MSNIVESETADESPCRACLINKGVLPIFGDENNPDISMEITMFGGIELHLSDDFPKFICLDCFKLLRGAVTFRNQARKADALLRRRKRKMALHSSTIKPIKDEMDIQNKSFLPKDINFVSVKVDDVIDETRELKSETTEFENELFEYTDNNIQSKSYIQLTEGPTVDFVEEVIEEHIDDELIDYNNVIEDSIIENDTDMVMLIVSDNKKTKKVEKIHCKYCNTDFERSEDYEKHRDSVEHKKNYVISFLPKKSIQKKSSTSIETKETVNPKDHKCHICNRMFTKLHYPRHMQTQHNIKMETTRSTSKKECTVCKKLFHPVALNRHMKKAHTDEKDLPPKVKLECPVCKKLFSKEFYPLHLQRHNQGDAKNYICDQCGKKFFFKSTFYTHRLIHSNDLPHKCDYCPYRGRTKGLLKTHVRTHTGDYPYQCTQCETRCLTKSNLNAHMQRHRGPVDFICDVCSRGFYSKLELQRHIAVIHQGIKSHVCNICGMAFGYRHGLMSHQLHVHKRAKGIGKPKAVYLKLEEEGVIPPA